MCASVEHNRVKAGSRDDRRNRCGLGGRRPPLRLPPVHAARRARAHRVAQHDRVRPRRARPRHPWTQLHRRHGRPLSMIRHTTAPHRLWRAEPGMTDEAFAQKLADDLEALIVAEGPDTVAAFIAEPVMGAGGVLVPPATYCDRIQAVLRRHDVLLIADEVITAFGRLGSWFGSELFGLEPDLITVAKGLTSGYFPLSGCIVSERVWRVLVDGPGR